MVSGPSEVEFHIFQMLEHNERNNYSIFFWVVEVVVVAETWAYKYMSDTQVSCGTAKTKVYNHICCFRTVPRKIGGVMFTNSYILIQ